MLMFIDEAARNQRTSQWSNGWALLGKQCIQRRFFVRGEQFSILPILTLDGIIIYDIIPRPVTSERFVEFLHELVVSHGCKSSLEAITEAGVRLSFRSL